ncbi:PEGA domain-containing protein [Marinobacter sp. F4218]|uniref:PEGA domain-containing protein n=1 Tax=Marinobacter sp. F4218 TaxID=2862868 RepID=UPI001C636635|nr:PEGA domain-containing protein [Marinobacter sp. F4218]MBW7470286.1 PEGA domain-containing protein [Marinobacter sp. F4218]
MVDFRPLLFINALALMLLVTAGFASVRADRTPLVTAEPPAIEQTLKTVADEPEPQAAQPHVFAEPAQAPGSQQIETETVATIAEPETTEQPRRPKVEAEPFSVPPMPEETTVLAVAEPPAAMATRTDVPPTPEPEPAKPAPTTGTLVLRSNVVGDTVTINGEAYGATRLDLELEPGRYDVTISKPGFKDWSRNVALEAGSEMTLVGKLEAYTTVNYRKGTWVGGVKTGDGTYEDKEGLRYEGHFVDGKFHGEGTAWYPDGSRYDGAWSEGQRDGEGTWRGADGARYAGEFSANRFGGKGTLTKANGDILTGFWKDGNLNGHGSLTTADGMLYVGAFRDNEFHGRGSLTYPDGRHYEGEFSNGKFHGTGAEVFADGKKYEGEYIEGKFHGKGLLLNPNGSSIEATFRHGEPYGKVRLTTAAGEIFTARTTEPGVCYRDKSYRATQCPKLEGW